MTNIFKYWYDKYLTHPDSTRLIVLIILSILILVTLGELLTPIAVSIIMAYLLDGLIVQLHNLRIPKLIATIVVLCLSIGIMLVTIVLLMPTLWDQMIKLVQDIPELVSKGQAVVVSFSTKYPEIGSEEIIETLFANVRDEITSIGQFIITLSLSSIPNIIVIILYIVMIPILIFLFIYDKERIISGLKGYLPKESKLFAIGHEINLKLGSYVRGKVLEMAIVMVVTWVTFMILKLDYALLLGSLVGLSVFVPFVGAIFVTIPIIIIGILQWGIGADFLSLCIAYSIILFLDANVLVPILFSGAMKMHPLTIIIAIFLFGGLWGFWGVFFAIPLAVIIKSMFFMWPKMDIAKS